METTIVGYIGFRVIIHFQFCRLDHKLLRQSFPVRNAKRILEIDPLKGPPLIQC